MEMLWRKGEINDAYRAYVVDADGLLVSSSTDMNSPPSPMFKIPLHRPEQRVLCGLCSKPMKRDDKVIGFVGRVTFDMYRCVDCQKTRWLESGKPPPPEPVGIKW